MKKKNFIPFIAIAVLCSACHDKTTLTGDWIEPVPGTTNTIQGFSLKENGEATSININLGRKRTTGSFYQEKASAITKQSHSLTL